MVTQPLDRQQMEYDPNALKDFRFQMENNDPWAVLGNRWQPDAVTMPINAGSVNPGAVSPAAGYKSPLRFPGDELPRPTPMAPPLQPPAAGYKPGQQFPGDELPRPTPMIPPTTGPIPPHAQANPRARLATAVMGATGMQRPPQFGSRPGLSMRGFGAQQRRPMFRNNRIGPASPRPFGG